MPTAELDMTRILFRCDASRLIGSGHLVRCRTLARELYRQGAEVLFLCRKQSGDLIALLQNEFRVLALPERPLLRCEGLTGRELYAAWLGCSQEQDAEECIEALASVGIYDATWVVVDHYGLDITWQSYLIAGLKNSADAKLLVVDDLADRRHNPQLLLDQNYFGESTRIRYDEFVPGHCRKLLGPRYALLGHEYSLLSPVVPPRCELRRVLVYFGGVDEEDLTTITIDALSTPELSHLAVDVVLGAQSPHHRSVARLVKERNHTTLHHLLPSLAGLMARADLAIGAGGATTWERICLRLPSIVVVTGLNQKCSSENLHHDGYITLLSDGSPLTPERIKIAVLDIANSYPGRVKDKNLVDGNGAMRIAGTMLEWRDESRRVMRR